MTRGDRGGPERPSRGPGGWIDLSVHRLLSRDELVAGLRTAGFDATVTPGLGRLVARFAAVRR